MKKLNITVLIIALSSCFTISALASDLDTLKSNLGLTVSYWQGIKSETGFQLGVERYTLRAGKYDVIQNASLLIQRRSNVYTSFSLTIGTTLRRNFKWGMFFDHSIRAGYAGHYYDFDSYKTNTNDEIVNVGRKWTSSMIVGYSFALGYNFSKITKQNISIFARPNIFLKFPNKDNLFLLNNFSIEAGVGYYFNRKKD